MTLGTALYLLLKTPPETRLLLLVSLFCLLVCLAGGALDAARKQRIQVLRKPGLLDVVFLAVFLLFLLVSP